MARKPLIQFALVTMALAVGLLLGRYAFPANVRKENFPPVIRTEASRNVFRDSRGKEWPLSPEGYSAPDLVAAAYGGEGVRMLYVEVGEHYMVYSLYEGPRDTTKDGSGSQLVKTHEVKIHRYDGDEPTDQAILADDYIYVLVKSLSDDAAESGCALFALDLRSDTSSPLTQISPQEACLLDAGENFAFLMGPTTGDVARAKFFVKDTGKRLEVKNEHGQGTFTEFYKPVGLRLKDHWNQGKKVAPVD